MNKAVKIFLIIVAFFIFFLLVMLLKGGNADQPGLGGIVGVILLFVFIAVARAIWKYEEDKTSSNQSTYIQSKNVKKSILVSENFDSLYDELLAKCNPQNYLEPYDFEKAQSANELYQRVLECDKEDEAILKQIRKEAILKLGAKFSTSHLYNEIWNEYDPSRFTGKVYDAEKFSIANTIRQKAVENAKNIEILEILVKEAEEKLGKRSNDIENKYDFIKDFFEGLAMVRKNYRYGYIDKEGNEVIALQYEDAKDFSEGLAMVCKNYRYGYIDKEGNEVIALQYEDAENFSEGLAVVRKDGKFGYIDRNGEVRIPFCHFNANSFQNGKAEVEIEKTWYYRDKLGNLLDKRNGNIIIEKEKKLCQNK